MKATVAAVCREYNALLNSLERTLKSEETARLKRQVLEHLSVALDHAERISRTLADFIRRDGVMRAIPAILALLIIAIAIPTL